MQHQTIITLFKIEELKEKHLNRLIIATFFLHTLFHHIRSLFSSHLNAKMKQYYLFSHIVSFMSSPRETTNILLFLCFFFHIPSLVSKWIFDELIMLLFHIPSLVSAPFGNQK